MKGRAKPLNDRIGEFIFYELLAGSLGRLPEAWLEVNDKNGNPVEIRLKRAKEKKNV